MRRWGVLAGYTALLYLVVPYTPRVGLACLRTPAGGFLFGRGLVALVLLGAVALVAAFRRWQAPWTAYALLLAAGAGYLAALRWLGVRPLERVHLPEYGLAALLAWRALRPSLGSDGAASVAAFALAAAIGWGEELVQAVTPGRYYALGDVAANALAAALALVVLAAVRTARSGCAPARERVAGAGLGVGG